MCAIAGLLSLTPDGWRNIQRMATLMRHRGPDDEGYLVVGPGGMQALGGADTPPEAFGVAMPYRPTAAFGKAAGPAGAWLALGHRRLSILDLSPLGHQPMSYRGRYWMVYNGEVYNYLELRAELQGLGHHFGSQTDTEVILAAYAQWGTGCFSRFNGMWGIAIYDSQADELVLSRDRFGVKPMYYWARNGQFAFASELKAFTCLPGWQPRVNGQAVHDFLFSSLQDHSAETMFAGVFQLDPGSYARLDCARWRASGGALAGGGLQLTRWYSLQPKSSRGSFEDAAARFRDLLTNSIRLRLRSDVPVGSCLSGGLDSSSIVCATSLLLRDQAVPCAHKTFSACSEIKQYDEREFVEHVVAATGVESHYIFPSLKDLFAELDKVIWHQDEPFSGTSIYAQWCVFKAAAQADIKVMLDGQGADEQLCGYPNFHRAFLCGLIRSGHGLTAWNEARAGRANLAGAVSGFGRAAVDAAIPVTLQRAFRQFRRNQLPPSWLAPKVLGASFPGPLASRFNRHTSARGLSLDLLNGGHLQALLHWEDRNSMAHSVESRVPFLDYRLVEFVTGLPDYYKIRLGLTKAVLREGMKDIVPAPVLARRDKMGFVTPEAVWAKQSGAEEFRRALKASVETCQGIVTPEALKLLEDGIAGRRDYDSAIWRMLSLGAWMRLFHVST